MSAYIIARIDVTDWTQYRKYMKETPGIVGRFGGRFIVRGGDLVTLEGPEESRRIAVIEFPSLEKAKEFYNSEEYTETRKLREHAAQASLVAVDGI